MKAVAYCRVSTSKEEQLDSLESQQNFFDGYAKKNGYELVYIYADEGKSGTKMKNRTQLLKLLADAATQSFEAVLIKDISRLARNTVDFLTSIRKLKALGIRVIFVNYDQTSSDSSEFMLTMLSAIAQEESANTSKRVRFGKKQNALLGRVPNLVFGYDKIPGNYFNLKVNQEEALAVRRIFIMYTEMGMGANRIAAVLNQEGFRTKRGCTWSQNGICRILSNEIYTGKIINGKQEIEDFLTGKRRNREADQWMIKENPELQIISEDLFLKANKLKKKRAALFPKPAGTQKHVLSRLIKCKVCGSAYRRLVRTYKNTYVTWVCNGRNSNGINYCGNKSSVDEAALLESVISYFTGILERNPFIVLHAFREYSKKQRSENKETKKEKDCNISLARKMREKQKYIDMYTNDIITMEALKVKSEQLDKEVKKIRLELEAIRQSKKKNMNKSGSMDFFFYVKQQFMNMDLVNLAVNKLIAEIEVDSDGTVEIFIKEYDSAAGP